mmetsp:Transcript_102216/g.243739  ORF Transcript_102216/g.243739 Transcript_102216/m.243739 type:complete len:219 (-) Transcript_102216:29-685(-)
MWRPPGSLACGAPVASAAPPRRRWEATAAPCAQLATRRPRCAGPGEAPPRDPAKGSRRRGRRTGRARWPRAAAGRGWSTAAPWRQRAALPGAPAAPAAPGPAVRCSRRPSRCPAKALHRPGPKPTASTPAFVRARACAARPPACPWRAAEHWSQSSWRTPVPSAPASGHRSPAAAPRRRSSAARRAACRSRSATPPSPSSGSLPARHPSRARPPRGTW